MLTRGQLNKKIQIVFNRYVRFRDCLAYQIEHGGELGCLCISCDKWYPFEKLEAGHWLSVGSASALRFHEQNVNAQCGFYCNRNKHGNPIPYRYAIDRKYGAGTADLLYSIRDKAKISTAELREKLKIYQSKLASVEEGNLPELPELEQDAGLPEPQIEKDYSPGKTPKRQDGLTCKICKLGAEHIYLIHEDGEEHHVCQFCLKGRHGKGWAAFKQSEIVDKEAVCEVYPCRMFVRRREAKVFWHSGGTMFKVPKKKK